MPTRLVPTWLLALAAFGMSAFAQDSTESAVVPAQRPGPPTRRHEALVDRAKQGNIDLLFLGDTLTSGWNGATSTWSRYYAPRKAANFGVGGDMTQNLLWRLDNGELEGIKPKVVVLMAGTHNIGRNTEAEVAEGVKAVVGRVRAKLPDSKILLLGILPRGSAENRSQLTSAPDPRVARVNARIATLDDCKSVKYLDIGVHFLDEAGQVTRDVMPDLVNLNLRGYQIWADAIEPTLWTMMEPRP